MKRKTMSVILHILLIIIVLLLGVFFFLFLPFYGQELMETEKEYAFAYGPCLIWAYVFALPIFMAIIPAWKICSSIKEKGGAFSDNNVKNLKFISILAFVDALVFPIGMIVMANLGVGSAPLTLVITPIVILVALTISFICYVLVRLVKEAVELKEESELTI